MCDQPPDCQKTLIDFALRPTAICPADHPWSGQGARSFTTASPLDQRRRSNCIRAKNPQGKPAGLRPSRTDGGWCRCGLIDVILPGSTGFPIEVQTLAPQLSLRSQTSQAKVSKVVLRKEVIQPQVPLRLPCYDLVPITGFIFGTALRLRRLRMPPALVA